LILISLLIFQKRGSIKKRLMIPLILTIFCSTTITLLLKYNEEKKGQPIVLLMSNYFVASLICLILLVITPNTKYSFITFGFGAALAFIFVFSFFIFTKAVAVAGAALASVSARLSVIIPIILSIIIFSEQPDSNQVVGFLLALITIILFYFSLKIVSLGKLKLLDYSYLFLLLLGIGFNDFCMKIFQHWRSEIEEPFFLFSIFTFAFIYTLTYSFIKQIKVERSTMIRGAILGIPNVFSSYFLLGALAQLPAIIVYPVTNVSIIFLTTLGAAIIWKERLNVFGKFALLFGCVAILFLSC
jgi:drug/metabolite transporter (DMT)-like permease